MTILELTDYEAETFILFQKHRKFFEVLLENNVHVMRDGNAILSFNNDGDLAKVRLEQVVYKK